MPRKRKTSSTKAKKRVHHSSKRESRTSKKEHHSAKKEHHTSLETKLVENLITLQKVQTDLAEKFDSLSKQIHALLTLFEHAARSFAQDPGIKALEKDKEFIKKIDSLIDQNKTIIKGLTLMEDRLREKVYGERELPEPPPQKVKKVEQEKYGESMFRPSAAGKPLPKF